LNRAGKAEIRAQFTQTAEANDDPPQRIASEATPVTAFAAHVRTRSDRDLHL
jgi:hypothetical protein